MEIKGFKLLNVINLSSSDHTFSYNLEGSNVLKRWPFAINTWAIAIVGVHHKKKETLWPTTSLWCDHKKWKMILLPCLLSSLLLHTHNGWCWRHHRRWCTWWRLATAGWFGCVEFITGYHHQIGGQAQQEASTSWSCGWRGRCLILQDPVGTLPDIVTVSVDFMGLGRRRAAAKGGERHLRVMWARCSARKRERTRGEFGVVGLGFF